MSRARQASEKKVRACARQSASARSSGGRERTCLQANTLMHRLLGDQMDHLVAFLEPPAHEASQRRARSAAGGHGCTRKCAARAAPGGRPRRLLVFAPRGVRAGGTWQMLRAHLRQNHSAMYSSQTEQSSSPIVRAASPRPPHPGLAPCAGRPAAACRLPWPFLNDEIGVYRPRYGAKVAGTNLRYQAGTRQYERGKISQPAHVCASAVVTGKSGNGGSAGTYSM